MRPIAKDDVFDLEVYEALRSVIQPHVLREKALRRVPVGPSVTALFENRESVLYQVHEVMRIEERGRDAIEPELTFWNDLVPREGELIVTLLVEDASRIACVEEELVLVAGGRPFHPGRVTPWRSDNRGAGVQFVRFALDDGLEHYLSATDVALRFESPAYPHGARLRDETLAALRRDLGELAPR